MAMRDRITFVGQAPSQFTVDKPWTGDAGVRLAKLCDVSHAEMLKIFDFINVLDYYPGRHKSGKGDVWPIRDAERAATDLWLSNRLSSRVVFVGNNVCKAFRVVYPRHFWWQLLRPATLPKLPLRLVTSIPHPSGLNRYYNDPGCVKNAVTFLADLTQREICRQNLLRSKQD